VRPGGIPRAAAWASCHVRAGASSPRRCTAGLGLWPVLALPMIRNSRSLRNACSTRAERTYKERLQIINVASFACGRCRCYLARPRAPAPPHKGRMCGRRRPARGPASRSECARASRGYLACNGDSDRPRSTQIDSDRHGSTQGTGGTRIDSDGRCRAAPLGHSISRTRLCLGASSVRAGSGGGGPFTGGGRGPVPGSSWARTRRGSVWPGPPSASPAPLGCQQLPPHPYAPANARSGASHARVSADRAKTRARAHARTCPVTRRRSQRTRARAPAGAP
jgi:hypothetical protein